MFRLAIFALISVVFREDVELQAGLGLFVLFLSVLAHVVVKPFIRKKLDRVEATALAANWLTLYLGTLLFSTRVSTGIKAILTLVVVLIQLGFVVYCSVEICTRDDDDDDDDESPLLTQALKAASIILSGGKDDQESGLSEMEMSNVSNATRRESDIVVTHNPGLGKLGARLSRLARRGEL